MRCGIGKRACWCACWNIICMELQIVPVKKIAGGTCIDKLEKRLPTGGSGCIISHAPGTGKSRLTIVFLQVFLKMYPTSRPLITAPRAMLLTWEEEFKKWKADIDITFSLPNPEQAEVLSAEVDDPQILATQKNASIDGKFRSFGLLVSASENLTKHIVVFFRVFRTANSFQSAHVC